VYTRRITISIPAHKIANAAANKIAFALHITVATQRIDIIFTARREGTTFLLPPAGIRYNAREIYPSKLIGDPEWFQVSQDKKSLKFQFKYPAFQARIRSVAFRYHKIILFLLFKHKYRCNSL